MRSAALKLEPRSERDPLPPLPLAPCEMPAARRLTEPCTRTQAIAAKARVAVARNTMMRHHHGCVVAEHV